MSYAVEYLDKNNQWGTVIHRFTTKREAAGFSKSHMKSCNNFGATIQQVRVVRSEDDPDMGWLHGCLVRLYPMEF